MAFGNKYNEKEVELTKEEKLQQIMKNQLEGPKKEASIIGSSSPDSEVEAFLVFQLVNSLNAGNSGMFHDRAKMAKRELEELQNLGYDLNQIYNAIYDTKR